MLDVQERIDFCVECLGNRLLKSQIKRAFWAKFDPEHKDEKGQRTSPQQIERYLRRAREVMHERFLERAANHADSAIAFLESVIRTPKSKYIEKLRAQEQLTELLGLAAAKKIEVSTTDKRESVSRRINEIFGIVRRPGMPPVVKESEPINGTNGNGHHAERNGHNGNGANGATNGYAEPEIDREAMEAME